MSSVRQDYFDKVTGRAQYSDDGRPSDIYHAKLLWTPFVSGIVEKIDTSAAECAAGVIKVITRKDIHGTNMHGMLGAYDHPVMIGEGERVQYSGDVLAMIVAESADEAERALDLIRVEYTPISAVHTVQEAIQNGTKPCFTKKIVRGDIEKGRDSSTAVASCSYSIITCEHAYIEPEGGYAYIDGNGCIKVVCGSQDIISNQRAICTSLGLQQKDVQLIVPYVGGAFGGKHSISVQIYLALAAKETNHSVSLVWTREESMEHSCKKQETQATLSLGLDRDGTISYLEGEVIGPNAPYMGNGRDNFNGTVAGIIGPYRYANVHLEGNLYPTTYPEQGAFRSVGACDGVFMFETLLTYAGAKLGLSQYEVRRRNWIRENDEITNLPSNPFMRNYSPKWQIQEVMDKALEIAGPLQKPSRDGWRVGRGLATAKPSFCTGNTDYHAGSTAEVHMFLDGSVVVKSGFPELGQGITAVMTHYASHALGISEKRIRVVLSDSHNTPSAGALGFSQATVNIGNAVLLACEKLKGEMEKEAALIMKTKAENVRYAGDCFINHETGETLEWSSFSEKAFASVSYLCAVGRWHGADDQKNIYGITPEACVVDVEIDPETGDYSIIQIVHCHDTGKVIHYQSARGQFIGAAVMGLGISCMEEFHMDKGLCKTPSFAEYLLPTTMDIPGKNEIVFLEGNLADKCPEGAKAVGEHGIYCVGACISNALFDALGIELTELPITSEKILRKLGRL